MLYYTKSSYVHDVDIKTCHFVPSIASALLISRVNFQNYWLFGFRPSSGILETRKHNVSETGSVPVLR
jgi:hypothetical protein